MIRHWATLLALIDATPASYDEVRATPTLGSRPLVVISANTAWFSRGAPADDARRVLNELHAELAGLSTNSRHRIVEGLLTAHCFTIAMMRKQQLPQLKRCSRQYKGVRS